MQNLSKSFYKFDFVRLLAPLRHPTSKILKNNALSSGGTYWAISTLTDRKDFEHKYLKKNLKPYV